MTYNRKIMRLELSVENPFHGGHYYTELLLPAADYELKDAMQRVRAAGRENTVEFNIFKCDILPKLQNICLDTFSLDELNFFAKRLISLTDEELPVFYAVTKQMFDDANEKPISIKDLINSTYGLDSVPVIYDVSNPTELGRYMLKHGLFEDADGTSQGAVSMLNAERLGEAQQKRDKGVFEDKLYIPTVHYKRPEVYGGVTLPDEESESGIFLLKVGAYPKSSFLTETPTLYDLHLPADSDKLFNAAEACGEPEINLCFCYEFYSSVPQITSDMFDSMDEIDALNMLAQCISAMSEAEQLKFKAVLESELTDSIQDALNIARNLQRYEFITEPHSADGFFKEYLSKNTDVRFDRKWLDRLYAQHILAQNIDEAVHLLNLSATRNFTPAQFILGRLLYKDEVIPKNITKAVEWLDRAAAQKNPYAAYLAGKIYLTEDEVKDIQKAIRSFKIAAENGNDYAEYQLGKIYLYGKDIPRDTDKAMYYLHLAAEHGNPYAAQLIHSIRVNGNWTAAIASLRLFGHIARIIKNRIEDKRKGGGTDRKLLRKIEEKKQAQGLRQG